MCMTALRHAIAELGTVRQSIPFDDHDLAEVSRQDLGGKEPTHARAGHNSTPPL
jgi:hypothetical protein